MKRYLRLKRVELLLSTLVAAVLLVCIPSIAFAAPAFQEDGPQAQAEKLVSEGDELLDAAQYEAALEKYSAALPLFQEAGDRVREGWCLLAIAHVKSNLGDHRGAIESYRDSLPIWQEAEDFQMEATTWQNIGVEYNTLGENTQALTHIQNALAIFRKINDRAGEQISLISIGQVYEEQGKYKQALGYYLLTLEIVRQDGNTDEELSLLDDIGEAYRRLGQYKQALDFNGQAYALAQRTENQAMEHAMLNNMGTVYRGLGQYDRALDSLQKALAFAKQNIDSGAEEAITLNNIGLVYDDLGQYEQALAFYQQALNLKHEDTEQAGLAITLNNIGSVYRNLGQYDQALNHHQQAARIAQQIHDANLAGTVLNNIGLDYEELNQHGEALKYLREALALVERSGDKALEGKLRLNVGFLLEKLGEPQQALSYYQQALRIVEQTGNRAAEIAILNNLGTTHLILGEPHKAISYLEDALEIAREIRYPSGERNALRNMGTFYELQGDIDQALINYQQAVEVTESMQNEITIEELKGSFAAENISEYQHVIRLLWDQKRFQEAFDYVERARARAFLDQLARGGIDYRAGADADLLRAEQALQDEILGLRTQLITLRNRPTNEWDVNTIAAVEDELFRLEADYSHLLTEIKLQSPQMAGLVSVDVASLGDIQNLLDAQTTLVEYFVTDDRILIFLITNSTLETSAVNISADQLLQTVTSFRDFARRHDPHPDSLKQLHSWLIAPLKDRLKTPVIGIIPHGTLHYLPFAALTDGVTYLGEEYTIFSLPSTSALRFILENHKPRADTVLALGNPAIEEPGLAPLESAQIEVQEIANLYGTQPLVGELATESALRSWAGTAGIVHLAAHGQYNVSNPLFSVIYLAADEEHDGRLEVNEIYSLDLTRATDLVVLAACQTQIGEVSAGDEVVGMTRAFLYAGTPSVIASLWKVDDEATTLLMERFYNHLRAGMGKARALQQAQMEVQAQYPHPYYWAAFVLTGDPGFYVPSTSTSSPLIGDRRLWFAGMGSLLSIGLCCSGLLTILVGAMVWRRRRKKGLR